MLINLDNYIILCLISYEVSTVSIIAHPLATFRQVIVITKPYNYATSPELFAHMLGRC